MHLVITHQEYKENALCSGGPGVLLRDIDYWEIR